MMLKVFFVFISIILVVVNSYKIGSPSLAFVPLYRRGTRLLSSTFETSVSPEVVNESPSPPPTTSTTSSSSSNTTSLPYLAERRPLKTALLALAARTKRGEIANEKEKTLALELITKLEGYNPINNPCNDELALGKWELIYSNTNLFRSSPFWMAARAVCQEGDQASTFNTFCDLHRDALAFTNVGRITQIISSTSLISEFETIVPLVPGLPFTITGTILSNSDIVSSTSNSWTLFMDNVTIKEDTSNIPFFNNLLNQFKGLPIRSLGSFLEENTNTITGYTNPKPIFYTYYVDTHMRISRDQDDNVFVYNRVL